ncbi:MAG: hypothetical protein JWR15_4246 [Prosthecobacter sp.]|nr:hypothetical protein [Prosthecobacter sp.]
MRTLRKPRDTPFQTPATWPLKRVQAMNLCLLTQPIVDVQRWFERQVVLHLSDTRPTDVPE